MNSSKASFGFYNLEAELQVKEVIDFQG